MLPEEEGLNDIVVAYSCDYGKPNQWLNSGRDRSGLGKDYQSGNIVQLSEKRGSLHQISDANILPGISFTKGDYIEIDFRNRENIEPSKIRNEGNGEGEVKHTNKAEAFSNSIHHQKQQLSEMIDGENSFANKNLSVNKKAKEQLSVRFSELHGCHKEAQKKKEQKGNSIIGDIKIEFRGDELCIFNDKEDIENFPIDSLKVSTIYDISRSVIDKLNLETADNDDILILESKLENAMQMKPGFIHMKDSTSRLNTDKDKGLYMGSTLDNNDAQSMSQSEDDMLMYNIRNFRELYIKEYLEKVLKASVRDEGRATMKLRHEAEINELKKLHNEQKQELIDEISKRRTNAFSIREKMRKYVKPLWQHQHYDDFSSQIIDIESNSMRSRELSLRGSFYGPLPDNLSRINMIHRDHESSHKEYQDLINTPLLMNDRPINPISYSITDPANIETQSHGSIHHSEAGKRKDKPGEKLEIVNAHSSDFLQSFGHGESPILRSFTNEAEQITKHETVGFSSSKEIPNIRMKSLNLNTMITNQNSAEDVDQQQVLTQRTHDEQTGGKSSNEKMIKEEVSSLRNFSPQQLSPSFSFNCIAERFEV